MKRAYGFLKKAEVYYYATVEGNKPKVRPFGTIYENDKVDLKQYGIQRRNDMANDS